MGDFLSVPQTYLPNAAKMIQKAMLRFWKEKVAMGLKSAPYQACYAMGFAEEMIRGDRLDEANIFCWDHVRMNLPGSENYDPRLPWVSKLRSSDGHIAADIVTFVDDVRPSGPTKWEGWQAARRTGYTLSYLGLQDAARTKEG
jgi:hypothetical protein